jgi:hypothetical protein
LPECLDDFIDDSNPVRVIDAFVDALDYTTKTPSRDPVLSRSGNFLVQPVFLTAARCSSGLT